MSAPITDPTPVLAETSAAPVTEPITETPVLAEAAKPVEDAPATTTEAAEDEIKEDSKVIEPKESGHLHYNAPSNFLKEFLPIPPKKVFFWFGEEPVESSELKAYLAKGKEAATSTAAWASQTGKGLLFFNKHGEDKAAPSGALNLADAEDIKEAGTSEFTFKLHGHKHKFDAQSAPERDSWLASVKKIAEEAKAKKEEIVSSEGYKEALAKLKPAPVAAVMAPKISEDTTKKSVEEETPVEAEESKKTAKSRSRSRGPQIIGFFKGKKEEKKEEETPAVTEPTTEVATTEPIAETAPVVTDAVPAFEEAKKEEIAEEETPKEVKKDRRQSRFESFFKSKPKEAKKEEIVPTTEEPISAEPPKIEEPITSEPITEAVAPVITDAVPPVEETKAEEKAPSPTKDRKSSFVAGLKGFAQKVRSPSSEHPPAVAEPAKTEETPAVESAVEAPVTEAPVTEVPEVTDETPAANGETKTDKAEKRRSSFFNLATFNKKKTDATTPAAEEPVKAETADEVAPAVEEPIAAETPKKSIEEKPEAPVKEHKDSPFASLSRRVSKAIRGDKPKKDIKTPAKVEEPVAETAAAETEAPAITEAEPLKKEEPTSIGDVVPEAVTVGHAPAATPTVSATA